jgi:hypothetical protein
MMNEIDINKVYRQGFIDGIKCFAHWKDGIQEVGTTGKLLKSAIENVEGLWNFDETFKSKKN